MVWLTFYCKGTWFTTQYVVRKPRQRKRQRNDAIYHRLWLKWTSIPKSFHGLPVRYVKLLVTHAPGMPGMFTPPRRFSDPDMHHGTCVTHVSWYMPGSLTSGFLWNRWRENVPGIPGACATRNFTYLVKGPCKLCVALADLTQGGVLYCNYFELRKSLLDALWNYNHWRMKFANNPCQNFIRTNIFQKFSKLCCLMSNLTSFKTQLICIVFASLKYLWDMHKRSLFHISNGSVHMMDDRVATWAVKQSACVYLVRPSLTFVSSNFSFRSMCRGDLKVASYTGVQLVVDSAIGTGSHSCYMFSRDYTYLTCRHSFESPSMVDPQWNIWYWGSKWNLHTVYWSAVGCEWGTTSVYFGITYVCFIPSRFLSLLLSPSTYFEIFYFCQKNHLKNAYKFFKKIHVGF